MSPDTMFAKGEGLIEHPWFNQARNNLEPDGRSIKVKWVAVRGCIHDWAIYHSLDANLEKSDFLDGTAHLLESWERIYKYGAKLRKEDEIKKFVPCDDEAFTLYRQ